MACDPGCLFCEGHETCLCGCHKPAANVVSIFDRQPVSSTVNDADSEPYKVEVIELLEGLLERARAGEFTGLTAVLNGEADMTVIASLGALADPILFLGGLSRCAHRINMETDLDED